MNEAMTSIILAGGLGTRLRSVLPDLPKAMAPVRGRPFLEVLLARLRSAACTDVVLCVGYRSEAIEAHFGDGTKYGVCIRYFREEQLLGTAGAIGRARSLIRSEPVLVLNGDSYCGVDLQALLQWHESRRAAATLAATWMADTSRYGTLTLGPGGEVLGFREKETSAGAGTINAGVYVLGRNTLDMIPEGRPCSFERDVFPALIGRGLYAFRGPGPFIDIGVPEDLDQASAVLSDHFV